MEVVWEENKPRGLDLWKVGGGVWRCVWSAGPDKNVFPREKEELGKVDIFTISMKWSWAEPQQRWGVTETKRRQICTGPGGCCDCTRTGAADPVWRWLKGGTQLCACCTCWRFSLWLCFRATQLRSFCGGNGYIWIHPDTDKRVGNREWMKPV